jgi:hypothetical protein
VDTVVAGVQVIIELAFPTDLLRGKPFDMAIQKRIVRAARMARRRQIGLLIAG